MTHINSRHSERSEESPEFHGILHYVQDDHLAFVFVLYSQHTSR